MRRGWAIISGMVMRDVVIGTFIAAVVLAMCAEKKRPAPDLVLSGGTVYTLSPRLGKAEALAVEAGRIVAVGTREGIEKLALPKTRMIDLGGGIVIPGLVDAHAHVLGLGKSLDEIDLRGTDSPGAARQMVLDRIAAVPAGVWITGRGWDQNDWAEKRFPTWADLEGTERNPVSLRRIDGHAVWVNRTALDSCGIGPGTVDPPGGRIVRDGQGNPTGVLIDRAMELVLGKIPEPDRETKMEWIRNALAECNRYGLTGVHDAGVDEVTISVYEELLRRGELTLRIYAMLDGDDEELVDRFFAGGPVRDPGGYLTVRSVKIYADGALGSRGAALLEDYSDDAGNRGLMIMDGEGIYRMAKRALSSGFQVCTHAIGDRANRTVLDAYERALMETDIEDPRLRIEHAQVVSPEDVRRFCRLGIIPSMQPAHATSDMDWAEDRLGPERIRGAYAWRSFVDGGCRLPLGSDFPVERVDPLLGIYAAVTRRDPAGEPAGGWHPEQRLTVEEAVRGFTLEAAYAGFSEELTGSIEEGKLADMVVLDRDIFELPPSEILRAEVRCTIVGGKVVYEREEPR